MIGINKMLQLGRDMVIGGAVVLALNGCAFNEESFQDDEIQAVSTYTQPNEVSQFSGKGYNDYVNKYKLQQIHYKPVRQPDTATKYSRYRKKYSQHVGSGCCPKKKYKGKPVNMKRWRVKY